MAPAPPHLPVFDGIPKVEPFPSFEVHALPSCAGEPPLAWDSIRRGAFSPRYSTFPCQVGQARAPSSLERLTPSAVLHRIKSRCLPFRGAALKAAGRATPESSVSHRVGPADRFGAPTILGPDPLPVRRNHPCVCCWWTPGLWGPSAPSSFRYPCNLCPTQWVMSPYSSAPLFSLSSPAVRIPWSNMRLCGESGNCTRPHHRRPVMICVSSQEWSRCGDKPRRCR